MYITDTLYIFKTYLFAMHVQLQAEICQDIPTRGMFPTGFGPHLNILGPATDFLGILNQL